MIARVMARESLRIMAGEYHVSHETLNRLVNAGNVYESRRGPQPHMGHAGEAKLEEWLKTNESLARN